MKPYIYLIFIIMGLLGSITIHAINMDEIDAVINEEPSSDYRSDCIPAMAHRDLTVNKVRARILTGGDKWRDPNQWKVRYIVPVPPIGEPEFSVAYAGAIWAGGLDDEGNLKLAAQTYRNQNRNEWWPGPLNEDGMTDFGQCRDWDQIFRVTNEDVVEQRRNIQQYSQLGLPIPREKIPENILYWPAVGNPYFSERYDFDLPQGDQGLAPFFDFNSDGLYNPVDGDFPVLGLEDCGVSVDTRIPDEMFFWIFNDAGGIHTNSGGAPMHLEVRAQAFAFDAGNELDYMTFYRYQMVNRGASFLDSTFFGLWSDIDLGCPFDGYLGSNPEIDLAFVYSAKTPGGDCECGSYTNPYLCEFMPAVGINVLGGPKDSEGNNLGLSYFIYYNNRGGFDGPIATTDPTNPPEFYRYLNGVYRDGNPPQNVPDPNFAYPGNPSDPDAWTMCSDPEAGPGDRRKLMSSGPFRLDPGGYSEIVYGVPFILHADYPCPDLTRLFEVTKKTRTLFDQCFQLDMRGPDAPEMVVSRMNEAFSVELTNDFSGSNNRNQDYREKATFVPDDVQDQYYEFEGYVVYQLRSPDLPLTHETFTNPNLAIPVFQSDVENDVDIMYNWTRYENPNYYRARPIYIPDLMVDGANTGIENNFIIDRDMFDQSGDGRLQAGQDYYYVAIAYAHNDFRPFEWRSPEVGQAEPFLSSTQNLRVYTLNLDNDLLPQAEDGRAVLTDDETTSRDRWHFSLPGNPGTDFLQLRVTSKEEMDFKVRVISMDGRLMYSGYFSGEEYSINSQNWASGVYSVEMINLNDIKSSKSLLWVRH